MEVLIPLALLILIGTVVSVFHKAFRAYWVFSLSVATVVAVLYQVGAYLAQGYLDPFYKIAFVVSWIVFFGVASIGYFIYRQIAKRRTISGDDPARRN
ncbi:MAG: hypothetical protein ACT4P3_10100 [Betaproteobacteria bacterium]